AQDQWQLRSAEDDRVDIVPGLHSLDDVYQARSRLVRELAFDELAEVDLVDKRSVGLLRPDELDPGGLERPCEELALGRRPGREHAGSTDASGAGGVDECVEDAEHRHRRIPRDLVEGEVHRHRGDEPQPCAGAREPRDGCVEQADGRVEIAVEEGIEGRPAVQAVDRDRRIGPGRATLAPTGNETPVVVSGRLRPDAADDAEHALRRHRPSLAAGRSCPAAASSSGPSPELPARRLVARRGPEYARDVRSDDNFHDALNKAIKSTERYAKAEGTAERSKKLKREAEDLIETSRELVDDSKRRIAKRKESSKPKAPPS